MKKSIKTKKKTNSKPSKKRKCNSTAISEISSSTGMVLTEESNKPLNTIGALSEITQGPDGELSNQKRVESLMSFTKDGDSKIDYLLYMSTFHVFLQIERAITNLKMVDDALFTEERLNSMPVDDMMKIRKQLLDERFGLHDHIKSFQDRHGFGHFDPEKFLRNLWIKNDGLPELSMQEAGMAYRAFEAILSGLKDRLDDEKSDMNE